MTTTMAKFASNMTYAQINQCKEVYICSSRTFVLTHHRNTGGWKMRIAKAYIPAVLKDYLRKEYFGYYWRFIIGADYAKKLIMMVYDDAIAMPSPMTNPQESVTAPYWDENGKLYPVAQLFLIWKDFYMIPDPPEYVDLTDKADFTKDDAVELIAKSDCIDIQLVWMASEKLVHGEYDENDKPIMAIRPMLVRGDVAMDIQAQGRYLDTEEGALFFLTHYYTEYMAHPDTKLPIPLGIVTDRIPVNELNSTVDQILALYDPHAVIPPMNPKYQSWTGVGPKWSMTDYEKRKAAETSGGREMDEAIDKGCVRLMKEIFSYEVERVPDTFLGPAPDKKGEDDDDDVDTKVLDGPISELIKHMDKEIDTIVREKLGMTFEEIGAIARAAKEKGLICASDAVPTTSDGKHVKITPNASDIVRMMFGSTDKDQKVEQFESGAKLYLHSIDEAQRLSEMEAGAGCIGVEPEIAKADQA